MKILHVVAFVLGIAAFLLGLVITVGGEPPSGWGLLPAGAILAAGALIASALSGRKS